MTEACGAELPPLREYGWVCNGIGLVVVMRIGLSGKNLPIVLPARALEIHQPEPWWETPVAPFTGGDHLHLVVPRRPLPTSWRSYGVLMQPGSGVAYAVGGAPLPMWGDQE